jgi:LPS-assembly protein
VKVPYLPLLLASTLAIPLHAAERPTLPPGPATSVDAPAPYRYLDWVPRREIDGLPRAQRPRHTGVCPGYYLPPLIMSPAPDQADDTLLPVEAASDHYEMVGRDTIRMRGKVVVQRGKRLLESEQLDINTDSRRAELTGDVRIRQEGMLLTGEHAILDLEGKRMAVDDAEYVIHQTHVRGSATRIHNTRENVLVLDRSTYTTCEPGADTWYFQADDLRLNRETGWGTARNALIRVKDVPVVWLPWVMFPIDDRRQSGFLFPAIGTNDTTGFDYAQPYYWNIAPDMDATITPRYMSRRGTGTEAEFRYLTDNSSGQAGGAYLGNDELYDARARYLTLWKHTSAWSSGWGTQVDYSKVSDPDYFLDLGTNLDSSAQTYLNQSALTSYRTDHWTFGALVQSFQTLDKIIIASGPGARPYRRMPQLRADGFGQIGDSGLNWSLATEAVRFEHPDEDLPQPGSANRNTVSPGLGYRRETAWGYVSPRMRAIATRYRLLDNDDGEPVRTINTWVSSVDSGLILERQTSLAGRDQVQTLEPRLFLLYSPASESQNDIPLFDTTGYTFSYDQLFRDNRFIGGDRFGDARQASLGLTSRLIDVSSGEEWLRMSLGQAFYFADREVALSEDAPPVTTPRSAIANRISWQIGRRWTAYEDSEWDDATQNLDNLSVGLQYSDEENYVFNTSYIYHDPDATSASPGDEKIKQSDVSFILPLAARWSLLTRWGYDVERQRSFDNMVGIEYEACCWQLRLVNRRFLEESPDNLALVKPRQGIYLQFQLKGLGGVGNQVESLLESGIPGFEDREDTRRYRF